MTPIKLIPSFKDYIWGGTKLKDEFNKKCDLSKIAESWELSTHKDGPSILENGEYAGLTFSQYLENSNNIPLGSNCKRFNDFPILIKLIDAKDNLSVQVHPDNDYALKIEGEYGKTEMWYIVDCEPDSYLLYGFNKKISRNEFQRSIEDNTLLDIVNKVPVKKGDVFFIEAGTLHAIGKGILIAEIQQNSNTTYRIYDYGRLDAQGKPRDLHIEKALDVTNLNKTEIPYTSKKEDYSGYKSQLLSCCDYFTVINLDIYEKVTLCADNLSFNSVLVLNGKGKINYNGKSMDIKKGDSIFIPANFGEYIISGTLNIILTKID